MSGTAEESIAPLKRGLVVRLKSVGLLGKALLVALVVTTAAVGWYFLIYYQSVLHSATTAPTAEHTAVLMDHGRLFYVTPEQRALISHLDVYSSLLTITTLVAAFLLLGIFRDIIATIRILLRRADT